MSYCHILISTDKVLGRVKVGEECLFFYPWWEISQGCRKTIIDTNQRGDTYVEFKNLAVVIGRDCEEEG